MKVTFIVPSYHYFDDPFRQTPYWELYYTTILKEQLKDKNADINVIDLRRDTETVNNIEERDDYLYWILKSGDANEIYSIVKILKEKYPNSKHIAGGTHVDMVPNECEKVFDSIIVGPAENNFAKAILNNEKRYIENYNNIPFSNTSYPQREFLPESSIISNNIFKAYGDLRATMVYFSRGCFYKCAYCVYNVPNKLQSKSGELIEQELTYLKKNYNIQAILLKDEIAINPNKRIFESQMNAIGNANLIWRGQTISIATKEQLKIAKESGCIELSVGIETVDDNVMRIVDKEWQTQKRISSFIDNAKEVGIKVKICLIFGLPGEPRDIVEKTIKFIDTHKPDYVNVSGFCPFPGSPIYKNPEKYGIEFIDKDWSKYAHLLYRHSDNEEVGLPFRYKKQTPWGQSFERKEIVNNIQTLQRWLKSKAMTY